MTQGLILNSGSKTLSLTLPECRRCMLRFCHRGGIISFEMHRLRSGMFERGGVAAL